jgi:UDP:flavonoid glycosyltransferase YjiC (YdhE family)
LPLTPDQHLWACALKVEEMQAGDALKYATTRIENLEAERDHDGAEAWRQIRKRIRALQKSPRATRQ